MAVGATFHGNFADAKVDSERLKNAAFDDVTHCFVVDDDDSI